MALGWRSHQTGTRMSSLPSRIVRAEQWWSHKLAPLSAIFYATLSRDGTGVAAVWPQALLLLAGLCAGAAYVSVSNDLADRRDDRIAGKANRLARLAPGSAAVLVAITLAAGTAVAWQWRASPMLVAAYAAAWLSFTAYSVPPLRLKARGAAGVFADAMGAHCLPSLVAVLAADLAAARVPDLLWCALVAIWSAAYGARGILWHQLLDQAVDRASATATFVQRHGRELARTFARRLFFPAETLALAGLLWLLPGRASLAALALYGLFAIGKMQRFRLEAALVAPGERYLLIMADFYVVFWPLALLAASASHNTADLAALAVHLALFGPACAMVVRDALRLTQRDL